jgi:hypothetical protein
MTIFDVLLLSLKPIEIRPRINSAGDLLVSGILHSITLEWLNSLLWSSTSE